MSACSAHHLGSPRHPILRRLPPTNGRKLRIIRPRLRADGSAQCLPLLLGGHRECEPLVGPGAREHALGCRLRAPIPPPGHQLAVDFELEDLLGGDVHGQVDHRHLDVLAPARLAALLQRGEDGERPVDAGEGSHKPGAIGGPSS